MENPIPGGLGLLVEEHIVNIGIPLYVFGFRCFDDFLHWIFFLVFASLRSSLLCIMGEFTGGRLLAVAFSVSD